MNTCERCVELEREIEALKEQKEKGLIDFMQILVDMYLRSVVSLKEWRQGMLIEFVNRSMPHLSPERQTEIQALLKKTEG